MAAPLDAFLTANQSNVPGTVELEAAYDLVNSTVDVFNIRDKDAIYAGTNVGDYRGGHLRAGIAITPRIWIDGGFWQRKLDYRNDVADIKSWQLAAQYKLVDGIGYQPAIALRAGAWGNYSNELKKTSPTSVAGRTLDGITVDSPKDNQYQLDLIGTSTLSAHTELSMFVGAGTGKVTLNGVAANIAGCNYNLNFSPSVIEGTLAAPCNGADKISYPNSAAGIDINNEAQYRANFLNAGLMLNWKKDDWQLRGGYQYQHLKRKQIDDIISSRGVSSYQSNHTLVGEVKYQVIKEAAVFLRGQYMTNQFVGDIPFAYNTLTASRFGKAYGFVSAGVLVTF
jgi:hypothetical protein